MRVVFADRDTRWIVLLLIGNVIIGALILLYHLRLVVMTCSAR